MRVVCIAIPEKGHLHPLLPTLRGLESRGHDVVVAAVRDVESTLRHAHLRARMAVLDVPPPPSSFVTSGAVFAERLRDPAWLSSWIEALLIDSVAAQVPAIEALLRRDRPDVVVADPMLYAAAIACARLEIPWAALSSSLNPLTPVAWRCTLTDTLDRLADKRRALFDDHDVDVPRFWVSDAESPWLNVVFSVDAWASRAENPAVFAVGAPFDDDEHRHRGDVAFPRERLRADRRKLYVSFGSQAFFQPRLFALVFAAARALDLQVIASVGDLVDDDDFMRAAPPDAIVVRSAPQLEVLAQVDVFVSHGGANSVLEATWFARPLVLLPLCNDQTLQARFVAAAGAGVVVDVDTVDAERLVTAFKQALALDCSAMSTALRAGGGPAQVVELVERLGRDRQPLRP
ncbi:MAG: glycosyltransferase [Deltaproteobacteria bacterium]|nr:glycosyltransferase [Deltaproteobacteria bacterium]